MGTAVLFFTCRAGLHSSSYEQPLAEHGFRIRACPTTAALRANLKLELERAAQTKGPVMVVLAAGAPSNRSAASILAAFPQVGVLVCVDACDDAALASALQLGVDTWCPRTCSPEILALSLHGLKRRLEHQPTQPAPAIPSYSRNVEPGAWALEDQGWGLKTPEGQLVRLTSAERKFVLRLARRPGKATSHAQLLQTLGRSPSDSIAARSVLGVLVSRLRRKVAAHGTELPLRSVHNEGYMLTTDIRL